MSDSPRGQMAKTEPPFTVGGQAVLEGVMMRAPNAWAVAVRRPDGSIEAIRHELPRLISRSKLAKVPFIRGVLVLAESVTLGFRALSWSAQKAVGEEEEPLSKTQLAGSMTVAIVLFAGLFIILPAVVARMAAGDSTLLFNVTEALIRLGIFVGYIWLIGRSKEISRVFRYHGAEHMAIHAFEAGDPLSVDSIEKYRPEHPRCGTSFLLLVVLISIFVFSLVGRPPLLWLILSRLVLIPVVAGVSYEILKFGWAKAGNTFGRVLSAPGLWLQRLTTGQPEEGMIEVAVTSLLSSLDREVVDAVLARGAAPEASMTARVVTNPA